MLIYSTLNRFTAFSGFSAVVLYPRPALSLYNLVFTLLPPFVICLVADESAMDSTLWYSSRGASKGFIDSRRLCPWLLAAIFHSIVVYIFTFLRYGTQYVTSKHVHVNCQLFNFSYPPENQDLISLGQLCYAEILLVVCLKAIMEASCQSINLKAQLAVCFSIVSWTLFCLAQRY